MSERPYDDAMRELDERLDAALDALNAERAPDVGPDDDPELLDLIDTARLLRRLRDPAVPDDAFHERLAAGLSGQLGGQASRPSFSPNGKSEIVALPAVREQRRGRALLLLLAAALRTLTVAALAGMLAGAVAGGLGARLAMRVAGIFYRHDHPGQVAITESSGRVVGSFSWGGTGDLIGQAMIIGLLGGLAFAIVGPWLARAGRRWEGLAYGLVLLLAAGTIVLNADDGDFRRIGLPWLNVLMFAGLFILFGLVFMPIARRLERRLPPLSFRRPWKPRTVAASLLMVVSGGIFAGLPLLLFMLSSLVALVASVAGVLGLAPEEAPSSWLDVLRAFLLAAILIGLPLVRFARSPLSEPLAGDALVVVALRGRTATRAVDAMLGLAVVAGGVTTLYAVLRILG